MKSIILILILTIALLINIEDLSAQWIQQNSGTTQSLTDVVMLDTATTKNELGI
jgi:hypothetical protein